MLCPARLIRKNLLVKMVLQAVIFIRFSVKCERRLKTTGTYSTPQFSGKLARKIDKHGGVPHAYARYCNAVLKDDFALLCEQANFDPGKI